jgi:uncharacterized phage protein (TIGR01671 family)
MREILFRGKSIMRGEWIYGYLNQHRGNIRYDCDCEPIADGCYYINDWQTKIETGMYGQDYKVDSSTVGQFTGLTDKNGVKVFEGDIVRYGDTIHRVVFEQRNGTAYFGLVYAACETLPFGHYQDLKQIEVIGNIYDNPELLEVSGDE